MVSVSIVATYLKLGPNAPAPANEKQNPAIIRTMSNAHNIPETDFQKLKIFNTKLKWPPKIIILKLPLATQICVQKI